MKVKIKKLYDGAVLPSYAKPGDAGLDLTATERWVEGDKVCYGTGLAIEIPEGFVGLVFPRSSIAKKELLLSNSVGVIDSGYRGEIKAKFMLTDYPETDKIYEVGERIAQLIIMPYPRIEFEEVNELSKTERGTGGYGSTNK